MPSASSSPKDSTNSSREELVQFYFVARPLKASPLSFSGNSIIDFRTSSQPSTRITTDPLSSNQTTVIYSKTFGRHSSALYWLCGNNKRISQSLFKVNVTASVPSSSDATQRSVHSSLPRHRVSVQSFDKNHLLSIRQRSVGKDGNTLTTASEHHIIESGSSGDDATASCTQSTACIRVSDTCAAWATREMKYNDTYSLCLDDTVILSNFAELTLAAVVVEQNAKTEKPPLTSAEGRNAHSFYKMDLSDDVLRVKLTYGAWSHVAREAKRDILLEAAEMRAAQRRAKAYAPLPPLVDEVQLRATTSVLLHQHPTLSMDGEGTTAQVSNSIQQVVEIESDGRTHDGEVSVTPRTAVRRAAATPRSSQPPQQPQQPPQQEELPSVETSTSTSPASVTVSAKRRRSRSTSASPLKESAAPDRQKAMHRERTDEPADGTAKATVAPAEVPATCHETAVGNSASVLVTKSVPQRHSGHTPADELAHQSHPNGETSGGKQRQRGAATKEKSALSASFISATDSFSAENSCHSGRLVRRTPKRGGGRPSSLNNSYVNDNTCGETFDRRLHEALLELEQNAFPGTAQEEVVAQSESMHNLLGADEEECAPRSVVSGTHPTTTTATTATTATTTTTSASTTTTTATNKKRQSAVPVPVHPADIYVAATPTNQGRSAHSADKDSTSLRASLAISSQQSEKDESSRSRGSKKTPSRGRLSAKKSTPCKKSPATGKKTNKPSRRSSPQKGRSPSVARTRPENRSEATHRKVSLATGGGAPLRQQLSRVKTYTGLKSSFGLTSQYAPAQPNNADSQEVFFEH